MSVVEVRNIGEDFGVTAEFNGERIIRNSVRQQDVRTDNKSDTGWDVLDDPRVIQPFSGYPGYEHARAKRVTVKRMDESTFFWWRVSAQYSTDIPKREEEPDPTKRPARIRWGTQEYIRPLLVDAEGFPVINTAGDFMQKEVTDSRWVISIEKNMSRIPTWILDYDNVINSQAFKIQRITFPKRTALLNRLQIGDIKEENDIEFYGLSFTLSHNKDTWDEIVPSRGFYERYDPADPDGTLGGEEFTAKRRIRIEGEDATEPQFLDKHGRLVTFDDNPLQFDNDGKLQANPKLKEIALIKLRPYKAKPFTGKIPLK